VGKIIAVPISRAVKHDGVFGIGGQTLHSFGGIRFQNAKGTSVNPGVSLVGSDNVSKMVVKCKDLRFLFIDEFEAMAVSLASDLEVSLLNGVPQKNSYRSHSPHGYLARQGSVDRSFGGVNTFIFGDLYQLAPVGGVAFMSNPCSKSVQDSTSVGTMMSRIWSCFDDDDPDSLQTWSVPFCSYQDS
jgi:hypothetical protein